MCLIVIYLCVVFSKKVLKVVVLVIILLFIYLVLYILLVTNKALKSKRLTLGILVFSLRPFLAIILFLTKVPFIKALATF